MKKQILIATLLSLTTAAAGTQVLAKQGAGPRHEKPTFEQLDANGDGALTRDELAARGQERFAKADQNGDGVLSADELNARAQERAAKRTAAMIAGITNIITETLSSIRVVKAFAMEEYEVQRFFKETHHYFQLILRRAKLRLLASPITETIGVMIGVLLLWVGGLEVLSGEGLTPEDFLRFILLLFAMMDPLRKLSKVNVALQTGAASAERVFSILDTPPTIVDKVDAVKIDSFKEKITISNVSFKYESDDKVLKNISIFNVKN